MPRSDKGAAVAELWEWVTGFCTEFGVDPDFRRSWPMFEAAWDHFREIPRRKRMTPAEQEWLQDFGKEYGIPPDKWQAAYDALRAYIPPDRRKLASERQQRRFKELCATFVKDPAADLKEVPEPPAEFQ